MIPSFKHAFNESARCKIPIPGVEKRKFEN